MKYDVRIYPVHKESSRIKAKATIAINMGEEEKFVVNGIRIIEGKNGLFVAMPQFTAKDGEYRNICYSTKRQNLDTAILEAYEYMLTEYCQDTDLRPASSGESREIEGIFHTSEKSSGNEKSQEQPMTEKEIEIGM